MRTRSDAFLEEERFGGGRFDRRWVESYYLFLMILICACVVCLGRGIATERPGQEVALLDRVNPNTATPGSLIRLEGIGPVRAHAILAYRKAHAAEGQHVFASPQALEAVAGIGPKTVEKLTPYLDFTEVIPLQEQ